MLCSFRQPLIKYQLKVAPFYLGVSAGRMVIYDVLGGLVMIHSISLSIAENIIFAEAIFKIQIARKHIPNIM